MLAYDELCNYMFNDFVATCGDFNTQVSTAFKASTTYIAKNHMRFPA